ncbi:MAG: DUF4172 domain-containing protein [Phycisphaerae bacterium]|nr:DUF4172 domain-containing protein [Saprospiraceae bacterium]
MAKYIYEHKNWTDFSWQYSAINVVFGEVRLMQGKIIGQMNALGFSAKEEATPPKTPHKKYCAKLNFGNYTNIPPSTNAND